MSVLEVIENDFHLKVGESLSLLPKSAGRYTVLTPFTFDDGDHLVIVLKRAETGWELSDEGHTFMHLSYDLDEGDFLVGRRREIIRQTLASYSVVDRDGELVLSVSDENDGDALYRFVQALLKISAVVTLIRERSL